MPRAVLTLTLVGALSLLPRALMPEDDPTISEWGLHFLSVRLLVSDEESHVTRCLLSQFGSNFDRLTTSTLVCELSELAQLLKTVREPFSLTTRLVAIEYCRGALECMEDRRNYQPEALETFRRRVAEFCQIFLKGVSQAKLTGLQALVKQEETKVRLEFNRRHGRSPHERVYPPSGYPYGSSAVLSREKHWDAEKWTDFIILRAHELRNSLLSESYIRSRALLSLNEAGKPFPPSLKKMAGYLRKTEDPSDVAQVLLHYEARDKRCDELIRRMWKGFDWRGQD